uniref:Uncharacterized protein n=1 Tax=Acrobeloides nanus TaxID=290746 RepID=A0A914C6K7_9BILA
MSGDKELYERTIVEIDQSENSDSLEIGGLPITSMPSSTEATTKLLSTRTTTSTPTTAISRSTKSTHNKGGAIRLHEVTEKSRQSGVTIHAGSSIVLDESERASQDIPSMRYGRLHKNHEEGSTQVSLFSPASIEPVLSKSGSQHREKDTNPHRLRQHEHKGATRITTKTTTSPTKISTVPKSVVTVRPRTTTSSSTTERPTTNTTPLKTTVWPERASNDIVIPPDEPVDKKIHVIRVGPNDQYEHVIGSQEFSNIIQKEAMKALSTDSTASTTPENDLEYEDDAETFYEHDEQETKHPIHMVDVSRIQKSINSGEAEGPMNEYFDTGSLSHATRLSSTNLFELIFIFIFYLIIV